MDILIAGDFYVSDKFRNRDLFDPTVKKLFLDADYRVVNLESPVTVGRKNDKIRKTGPHLHSAKETTLPLLKALRIDLATLANNHIMDFGPPGLIATLENLRGAGIETVGAGMNAAEASNPFCLEREGLRIAFLNFTEREWSAAGFDKPGAAALDLAENLARIRAARQCSEIVIVIIHGGYEMSHLPSPRMVRQYRLYAENGASLIVGHHSHYISGSECRQGVPIYYGLGNFLFTESWPTDAWYTGLVLSLRVRADASIACELVPVRQSRESHLLTLVQGDAREEIMRQVGAYTAIIDDPALLAEAWKGLLKERGRNYLNAFSPMNMIGNNALKSGLTRFGLDRLFRKKAHYAQMLNLMRCEAHADACQEIIEDFLR